MHHWVEMIKERLDVLNVSLRYLESDSAKNQIYLIENAEETIIWFLAESETGKFGEYFIKRGKELAKLNVPVKSCYLRYVSGKDVIKAHIGFGVPYDIQISGLSESALRENMPSCICIALPFHEPLTEIQKGYRKLINYANEHNWIPTGSILEWYRGDDFTNIDLLMPVTRVGKRRICKMLLNKELVVRIVELSGNYYQFGLAQGKELRSLPILEELNQLKELTKTPM